MKHFLSSVSVLMYASELTVSPLSIASTRIIPSQFQKTVTMTLPDDAKFFYLPLSGRLRIVPFHGLPFSLQLRMMDPGVMCC
jgi:hypothetical protein